MGETMRQKTFKETLKIGDKVIVQEQTVQGELSPKDFWEGQIIKIDGIMAFVKDISKTGSGRGEGFWRLKTLLKKEEK